MMQLKRTLDYCNKLILAPMVRGSLLPMRMLALRYGANLVYTDELIDQSLLLAERKENDILGTVDYVNHLNGYLVFRTSPLEKEKLVFQMGTADADRAVKLAKMVQHDVSAIDVNMGCPRPYSTSIGMGAALLSRPETAKSILKALVENINLPITCKIRIFDDVDQTIELVKELEALGISAIAVHGRTRNQRPKDAVNIDAIRKVAENVSIPVIANGGSSEMNCLEDVEKFKLDCGASSVMVARAAQQNVSIFRREGPIPAEELIPEYLKQCVDFDNPIENTKYSIQIMYKCIRKIQKEKFGRQFDDASTLQDLCDLWNIGDYCREKTAIFNSKGLVTLPSSPLRNFDSMTPELLEMRKKVLNDENVTVSLTKFRRNYFSYETLPKTILHAHAGRNKLPLPVYESTKVERLFCSTLTFDGKKYASLLWDRERKHSEQNAALVCLLHLGLIDEEYLIAIGCLYK